MEREIKFRGKRLDNGEWVYGDLCQDKDVEMVAILLKAKKPYAIAADITINFHFKLMQVDPETVGQFIGLKTDTGKDVYDGDVITVPELVSLVNDFVDVIEFDNGSFRLCRATDILVCQELMDEGVSVIGNKWDNPELLITEEDGESDG